jgi:hypothetical protein
MKHRPCLPLFGLSCLLAIMLFGCGGGTTIKPGLYYPNHYQWSQVDGSSLPTVSVPTTAENPGPVVSEPLHHEQGLGSLLYGANLLSKEIATSHQIIALVTQHLSQSGWQALFKPTATGSFPQYVLYITFQSNSYYCFVEYSATEITLTQASQQLDIYYS